MKLERANKCLATTVVILPFPISRGGKASLGRLYVLTIAWKDIWPGIVASWKRKEVALQSRQINIRDGRESFVAAHSPDLLVTPESTIGMSSLQEGSSTAIFSMRGHVKVQLIDPFA